MDTVSALLRQPAATTSGRYRMSIAIGDRAVPAGATGLLIPLPPTTPHQHLQAWSVDPAWSTRAVAAQGAAQAALFATLPAHALQRPIEFRLADRGAAQASHYDAGVLRPPAVRADVAQLAAELGLPGCDDPATRLDRIVAGLAHKFRYQSGYVNEAPLSCDLLTGNCQSINDALLAMTAWAGIPSAYYIGYFFEPGVPLFADDWHCWVSTRTERGCEDWDIAHHLKRGLTPVRPALNPVPGLRFAMGVGRDLRFALPLTEARVPHLCEPRWVHADGTTRRCAVRVTVRDLGTRGHSD